MTLFRACTNNTIKYLFLASFLNVPLTCPTQIPRDNCRFPIPHVLDILGETERDRERESMRLYNR